MRRSQCEVRIGRLVPVWGALLLAGADLPAQQPKDSLPQSSQIVAGARIRITAFETERTGPDSGPVVTLTARRQSGTVVTVSSDTLVLKLDRGGEMAPFSMAQLTSVELRTRRKGGITAAGLGLGLLIGAGAGAALAVFYPGAGALFQAIHADGDPDAYAKGVLLTGALGGIAGMTIGGLAGAARVTERWTVAPPSRWRVSGGPSRGGAAVMLSKRF